MTVGRFALPSDNPLYPLRDGKIGEYRLIWCFIASEIRQT
jgi:hypothetical protein